jgi:hypothetical protein|tara:strand:+ start:2389 stop:2598 length:210 start_codon:yes stop_codon:yes gene_type:complete
MKDFYVNDKFNYHVSEHPGKELTLKQRRTEIIKNLSECIQKELQKGGGGNKDLIDKLQVKLDISLAKNK